MKILEKKKILYYLLSLCIVEVEVKIKGRNIFKIIGRICFGLTFLDMWTTTHFIE